MEDNYVYIVTESALYHIGCNTSIKIYDNIDSAMKYYQSRYDCLTKYHAPKHIYRRHYKHDNITDIVTTIVLNNDDRVVLKVLKKLINK